MSVFVRFGAMGRAICLGLVMMPVASLANDAATLAAALARVDARDGAGAATIAARSADPVVADLVVWARLVDGEGSWGEYARHLDRHGDWPRTAAIRRHAERAMPGGLDPNWVARFFDANPPLTGAGALRHAEALAALGRAAAAEATLAAAWTNRSLTADEREAFQRQHPAMTRRLATARLDAMLWEGNQAQAEALLPMVPAEWRALAEARIALRARRPGVDGLVARVPASLSNDPGLAYERFLWRLRGGLDASAEELLSQRTGSAASLGRPDLWAERRALMVRRLLREGRPAEAYRIASLHHLTDGSAYADLEWLSGWIALRQLQDPAKAVPHFARVWEGVATPISKGRAGYWLGRAHQAAGDSARAQQWYVAAAEHATSFYGQLAAERIGRDLTAALRESGPAAQPALLPETTVRATRLLHAAGEEARAYAFLLALAQGQREVGGLAAAGRLALDLGRPEAAVRIGKIAAGMGHVIMDIYYPVTEIAARRGPIEPALALAIARQESEFNPRAISPAGARGLMQLMPATAERVARELGVRHTTAKLIDDPSHNATLGKAYLAQRLERYRGAAILAAAAYNAGAGRVDEWIQRFGDPRNPRLDAIDWIETIPFSETRNYVQRVMEGLHIYRARLGETPTGFAEALVTPRG